MGISQFCNTLSIIRRNPYVNFYKATYKHVLWQFRKLFNVFPVRLDVGSFSIIVHDKTIANGCGGLINSMKLYDPNNMALIAELSNTGFVNCMFDVGANIGIYSLIPDGAVQVYSFEPHPFTYSLLLENVQLNERTNIHAFQLAIDNQNEWVHFSDVPGSSVNKLIKEDDGKDNTIMVQTVKGIDFCKEYDVRPDLLKIDTEGNEK